MSVTDQQILNEMQYHLVEPADNGLTWPSGQWTATEVIQLLNQRQNQFLKETMILLKRTALAQVLPEVVRHALPADWIVTQRIVWKATNGTYTEVPRSDTMEATNSIINWTFNFGDEDKPQLYNDAEAQTLTILTMPAVDVSGELQILYAYLGTALTGLGVNLTVPDEFAPTIKWGTLADMLSKLGRAYDTLRSQYCEQRYREGVEAARMMLSGWM